MSDSPHHTSTMTYLFGAALLIGLVVVMVVVLGGKPSGTTMMPTTTGAPATAGTTTKAAGGMDLGLGSGTIAGISVSVIVLVALLAWAASIHWRMNESERALGTRAGMRSRLAKDLGAMRGAFRRGPPPPGDKEALAAYLEGSQMYSKARENPKLSPGALNSLRDRAQGRLYDLEEHASTAESKEALKAYKAAEAHVKKAIARGDSAGRVRSLQDRLAGRRADLEDAVARR